MAIHNSDIAAIFEEIADLLDIEQANPFRVRAYRNAARIISGSAIEMKTMVEKGQDLEDLPGIGSDLANKIREIVSTGKCSVLVKLRKKTPHILVELLAIPGLGPKRVKALYQELDIHSLEQLAKAAKDGQISNLVGFGKKTEEALLKAIRSHIEEPKRMKLAIAAQYAEPLVKYLRLLPGVKKVVIAGSYRRCSETVGDIDILVIADRGKILIDQFVQYDEVAKILSQGSTRATVLLSNKLQIDLRVVTEESFGAALVYFTGSKAHNIAIRRIGQHMGLKVNEYGVFRGKRIIAGKTEESVYKALGLTYIPPELRENRGEVEAAQAKQMPHLVELIDLRGDLHSHTKYTDGKNTIKEMAMAAKEMGLEYLAISDHSKHLSVAKGLTAERLLNQIAEIDKMNEEFKGFTILKSLEVDILENGRLDMPDEVLAKLDLVICSIHSHFNLSRIEQTKRVMFAMQNPYFSIFAHPSGRLIAEREPYDIDMQQIIAQARQEGCFLELNAHPERLDLLDVYCRMAKEAKVLISINSDAHSVQDFANLRFGIGQARRGWLTKRDVLNTRPLNELLLLLSMRRRANLISA